MKLLHQYIFNIRDSDPSEIWVRLESFADFLGMATWDDSPKTHLATNEHEGSFASLFRRLSTYLASAYFL